MDTKGHGTGSAFNFIMGLKDHDLYDNEALYCMASLLEICIDRADPRIVLSFYALGRPDPGGSLIAVFIELVQSEALVRSVFNEVVNKYLDYKEAAGYRYHDVKI